MKQLKINTRLGLRIRYVQSTVMPDKRPNFNNWSLGIRKTLMDMAKRRVA
jgi:hypothetical protein